VSEKIWLARKRVKVPPIHSATALSVVKAMFWSNSLPKNACIIAAAWATLAAGDRSGVGSAPDIDDADNVEFYVIESSFPYNAPENIR
jgi:hypothetical protein